VRFVREWRNNFSRMAAFARLRWWDFSPSRTSASLLLFVYYVGGWTADVKSEQRHMTDGAQRPAGRRSTRDPEAQSDNPLARGRGAVSIGDLARRVSTLEDRRVAKVRVQE
jgi:hypothetical protein